jgi:putative ABC transport system permease protein
MSMWSRIVNVFRGDRVSQDILEEIEGQIGAGSVLRTMDECRDVRVVAWLDSLRADTVFAWRQIRKKKVTSAVAILSLALAMGACTSAFRLIDALLLRPLPVAHPEQLYLLERQGVGFTGKPETGDFWAYPAFQRMRAAVKGKAELIAASYAWPMDVTYRSDAEMEKAYLQYVSGWMFGAFGLHPAAGRLFTENDDLKPSAHPYAVISYDYWVRRFGRDARVLGNTFRLGDRVYEIVGVAPRQFTGTETGIFTDVFLPAMMSPDAMRDDATWHRTLVQLRPGVEIEPVRARLDSVSRNFERERAKGFKGMPREAIERFINLKMLMVPAAAGASNMQRDYRIALIAMGVLVALVLLIACANVANLMTAQAATRSREMALRVSIGAGRWRLIQLVLVESAWMAFLAAALGGWFAWQSAPFVVGMINPASNPARLILPADWRVAGFALALTVVVMLLFGVAPALRASAVKPANALKGGSDPHRRRGLTHTLIAAQVAFCFLVLFVAGLFAATFERLSHVETGFSSERLLALDAVAPKNEPRVYWEQVAEHLRAVPGVEKVAMAGWPLLAGGAWNSFISVEGAPPGPTLGYFLDVSPGWVDVMKIRFIQGGDFRPNDGSAAIVNEAFVKEFFRGSDPMGKPFTKGRTQFQIVGVVADTPYRSMREPILPVAFVPFQTATISQDTFMVRTRSADPLAMAATLRREVTLARSEFRVSNVRSQAELVAAQTVRERLIATLALFFAGVALLLAAIGLYGVLDYSVLQRRREIGIRIAIGAQAMDIAKRVAAEVFGMVMAGAVIGLALGMASVKYIEALLYRVKPGDPVMLAIPMVTLVAAALLAAAPAVVRAVRIDPVKMLRSE